MKILVVIPEFATGGAERVVCSLIRNLSSDNDTVTLLVFNSIKSNSMLDEIREKATIITLGKDKNSNFLFLVRLFRILFKRPRYDLIIANLQPAGFYLGLLLPVLKMPLIYVLHNEYKPLVNKIKRRILTGFFRSEKVTLVSVSSQIRDHFRTYFDMNTEVINNGIDTPFLSINKDTVRLEIDGYRKNRDTMVFIGVQRLVWFKNLPTLVSVFNHLDQNGHNVILLLVGDDPTDEKVELHKITSVKAPNVFLVGRKDNVADYLVISDCFCIVSSAFEGTPIALLEALSLGLPVIGTETGGIPSVIKDPQNGILCQPSFESIESAVMRFMKLSKEERESIGKENVRLFESDFTEKKMVQQYNDLIMKTIRH